MRRRGSNCAPRIPGDLQDDKRDCQADERVCHVNSERDDNGAQENTEADETVYAGVAPVSDECGTFEASPGLRANLGCDLVADETDDPGCRKPPQVRQVSRMEETLDRLYESNACAGEDCQHHEEASEAFA